MIFSGVVIGSNTLPDSKAFGAPSIGDNCYIGAGAKIIGGVAVGNNCRTGANAVVWRNVPDNTIVVVGEQRMISKDTLDNRFYVSRGNHRMYYQDGRWCRTTNSSEQGV